jgi:hypothetical protein
MESTRTCGGVSSIGNSEDYLDSTWTPLGLQWTGLELELQICRPLAAGLVQLESKWSLSIQSDSNRSPIGKVGGV